METPVLRLSRIKYVICHAFSTSSANIILIAHRDESSKASRVVFLRFMYRRVVMGDYLHG
jgi:hypothetical protein